MEDSTARKAGAFDSQADSGADAINEVNLSDGQKTAVIFGLANKRSIAWAIAQKLHAAGWRLAITYQNERLEQEAKDLITELPGAEGFMCDVSFDEQITALFEKLETRYGVLEGLVHSVAFAPAEELKGEFLNTSREGFRIAHDVSVYSLVAVARAAAPLMTAGGGIVTLTYYGAEKVVPSTTSWAWPRRRWRQRCGIWQTIWGPKAFASTPFPPGRSRRWPRAEFRSWARC